MSWEIQCPKGILEPVALYDQDFGVCVMGAFVGIRQGSSRSLRCCPKSGELRSVGFFVQIKRKGIAVSFDRVQGDEMLF